MGCNMYSDFLKKYAVLLAQFWVRKKCLNYFETSSKITVKFEAVGWEVQKLTL